MTCRPSALCSRMLIFSLGLLNGCAWEPTQSILHPAGPAAGGIAWLWWLMFWLFTAVFVLVIVLLALAVGLRRSRPQVNSSDTGSSESLPPLGRTGFIAAGGILLPVLMLTPIFILSLKTSAELRKDPSGPTIRVVGRMWWWEVQYPEQGLVTANEIHIPVGVPVRLEMTSADVMHSFWVPRLHGKRDLIPGITTEFWIQADAPGIYRGQCAEYCGTQHANMAFHVIALPQDQFQDWLTSPRRTTPSPATNDRGWNVFVAKGCSQCHAVAGTPAIGTAGPDLTTFGSRGTIASGILPNTRGNLAGWITNPQAIKPGAKMPRTYLDADELQALTEFLESRQ